MIRILLVCALALGACGTSTEKLRLELSDPAGTCKSSILDQIDSMVVELRSAGGTERNCLPVKDVELKALAGMQGELSRTARFTDLEEGDYSIKVEGYDDECPNPNELLACGFVELHLPASGETLTLPMTCDESSSPSSAFTACKAR